MSDRLNMRERARVTRAGIRACLDNPGKTPEELMDIATGSLVKDDPEQYGKLTVEQWERVIQLLMLIVSLFAK